MDMVFPCFIGGFEMWALPLRVTGVADSLKTSMSTRLWRRDNLADIWTIQQQIPGMQNLLGQNTVRRALAYQLPQLQRFHRI